MYRISESSSYRRSFKKVKRHKDFQIERLNDVINTLASGSKLDQRYRDHALSGDLKGARECHVQNDILLIYEIVENKLTLFLVDIGSHSELF